VSNVSTLRQTVQIENVAAIAVTEVVPDGGGFVRAIRVYASPDDTSGPPVFEVIVRSEDRENIKVTTPELRF